MSETLRTLTVSPQPHSYEGFAGQEFYRNVDAALLRQAPIVHKAVDFASGTGAIVEQLISLGKLQSPFNVVGIDIDQSAVDTARNKLKQHGKSVVFVKGNIEKDVPISTSSAELLTCFNSIHLTNAQLVLREASRILAPDGTLMLNSAYVKDKAYPPGTGRLWGLLLVLARAEAEKNGYSNIPKPVNFLTYTENDLINIALQSGFKDIKPEIYAAKMDPAAFKGICDYNDFAQGALPGVPTKAARSFLVNAVDPMFKKADVPFIVRNWLFLTARKA